MQVRLLHKSSRLCGIPFSVEFPSLWNSRLCAIPVSVEFPSLTGKALRVSDPLLQPV
jgi:hypothetical protein